MLVEIRLKRETGLAAGVVHQKEKRYMWLKITYTWIYILVKQGSKKKNNTDLKPIGQSNSELGNIITMLI